MTNNYKVTVSRAVTATEVREFTVLAEDRARAREIAAMYAEEGCSTCVAPATPVVNVMSMTNQEIKARMKDGQKFYGYCTRTEQAIYTTNNPAAFGDYVAILPKRAALNVEPIRL